MDPATGERIEDGPSVDPATGERRTAFVPGPREFLSRVADAAVDMPAGMLKNAGRLVQMVPGVAAATDAVFGLPAGASKQAMQPSNANQQAGGYLGDLALLAATGGAEAGGPILGRSAGYLSNPTVAQRGAVAAEDAAAFTADTYKAVKSALSTGPVTPDKVAGLIVKYGKSAVKAGLIGAGGYGAWETVKHLFL